MFFQSCDNSQKICLPTSVQPCRFMLQAIAGNIPFLILEMTENQCRRVQNYQNTFVKTVLKKRSKMLLFMYTVHNSTRPQLGNLITQRMASLYYKATCNSTLSCGLNCGANTAVKTWPNFYCFLKVSITVFSVEAI